MGAPRLLPTGLVLFRKGTESPRLAATLNALLLVPAVLALGALSFELLDPVWRELEARASYERFASTATTTEYRAPDGTFSFRHASSPDGLELVEDATASPLRGVDDLRRHARLALEVILTLGTLPITGPVEDDTPGRERAERYDTIELTP